MQEPNIGFRVKAPRNASLIRYDENKQACIVKCLDRRLSAVNPPEPFAWPDVAVIMIEDAGSVEKDRSTVTAGRYLVLRMHKRLGDPNIDKIAIERDAD